jgi:hypothetical protein
MTLDYVKKTAPSKIDSTSSAFHVPLKQIYVGMAATLREMEADGAGKAREIKDLTFMFKTLHGFYDLDVFDFVSFVNHSRCNNPSLVLKVPSCKSSTFQSSFFNRIVPLWNHTCKIASLGDLRSLAMFKSFLSRTYFNLLSSSFDVDMCCTWSLYRSCSCHRNS